MKKIFVILAETIDLLDGKFLEWERKIGIW